MNWLITGGAGFIGRNLVAHLHALGHVNIRIVDDLRTGSRTALQVVAPVRQLEASQLDSAPSGLELLQADVRDAPTALAAAHGCDVIVHLAANTGVQPSLEDPLADATTNVLGTVHYLEAARQHGIARFVFASSGGTVIGDVTPPIREDMVPNPKSPYGASKSAGEGYVAAYHGSFGIGSVGLRFSNVYGPGSTHKNSVVAKFIRRALEGQRLEVYGDGEQTRDFIFIDDLVDAVIRAAERTEIGGEIIQIASGRETSVRGIVELLLPILERHGARNVTVDAAAPLAGEIRRNYSDTSKARTLLGWEPRISLEEGLERTVAWFAGR